MPSQPSQFDSSVPVQSDASRCHSRRTFPAARQSSKLVLTAAANSSGSLYDWRLTCGLVSDLSLFSTASRSLSKASAKRRTPSSVSLVVISSMETPTLASVAITWRATLDAFRDHGHGRHRVSREAPCLRYPDRSFLRRTSHRCSWDSWCWCWPRARVEFARLSRRVSSIDQCRKSLDSPGR